MTATFVAKSICKEYGRRVTRNTGMSTQVKNFSAIKVICVTSYKSNID